jgi:hypothetical protein
MLIRRTRTAIDERGALLAFFRAPTRRRREVLG